MKLVIVCSLCAFLADKRRMGTSFRYHVSVNFISEIHQTIFPVPIYLLMSCTINEYKYIFHFNI